MKLLHLAIACLSAAAQAAFLPAQRTQLPQTARTVQRAATSSITMSTKGFVITGGAGGVGYAYADELVSHHGLVSAPERALTDARARFARRRCGWGTGW